MKQNFLWLLVALGLVAFIATTFGEDPPTSEAVKPVESTAPIASQPSQPRNPYDECSQNLTQLMSGFLASYGSDGVVPMNAINNASIKFPCPAAGKPTISATGTGSNDGVSLSNLTLFCRGENHRDIGAPEHYPEIHSVRGLSPLE
jgi:hypothetical protein